MEISSKALSSFQLKSTDMCTCNVRLHTQFGTDNLPAKQWIYCIQYPRQPPLQTPRHPFLKTRTHRLLLLRQTAVNTQMNTNCPLTVLKLRTEFNQTCPSNNNFGIPTFQAEYNFFMRNINVSIFKVIFAIFL